MVKSVMKFTLKHRQPSGSRASKTSKTTSELSTTYVGENAQVIIKLKQTCMNGVLTIFTEYLFKFFVIGFS